MKGLMFNCINWGGMDCHPDVSVQKHSRNFRSGAPISLRLVGDDREELDHICKNCELRFFETDKRECSVCGSKEFTERTGLEIESDGIKTFENSYLKCNICESPSILIRSQ